MCFCFRKKKDDSPGLNSRIAAPGTTQQSPASASLPMNPVSIPTPPIATPGLLTGSPVSGTPALASPLTTSVSIPPPQPPAALGNTVAQIATQTPWEKALQRLSPSDRAGIDLSPNSQGRTKLDILRGFAHEAEKTKQECEGRQWKYTDRSGAEVLVRDRVGMLLVNLKQYTSFGDLVVQPLPSVVSLAWGGFKILLQVAITDMENTSIAMESLDSLARVLGHCGIYEKLYGQQALDASQALNGALVDLYVLVLEYLCYLKRHLGHNTAVQGFKNIASGLKSRWEALLSMETAVDKEAGIAQQEAAGKHMYANDERIQEMMVLLKETSALREPILRIKSTVEETKHIVENIFKSIKDDERLEILNWLSDVSHRQHHDFNRSVRTPGTGGWLLDKPNFRNWNGEDSSSLLWLHGIAGSGKTTLASKIIDDVEPETKEYSLAYFYCNYKEDQRKDPASILRSLVKQLCLGTPGVGSLAGFPEPVLAIYNKRRDNADLSNLLSIEECKVLLIRLSAGFLRSTIVIDALDECDPNTRGKLCDLLAQVVSSSKRVKVFVTSRDDGDLRTKFEDSPNVYIQERDNSGDIDRYIEAEIKACVSEKRLLSGKASLGLQKEIIGALQAGAHGMFIWVKHQITKICHEVTEEGVRTALTELSKDLNDVYFEILCSIRTHKSSRTSAMAERALTFVLYAVRPLSADELIAAVSSPRTPGGLILPVLLDICRGLVVLDDRLGVLRFAHFSVQEFLLMQVDAEEGHGVVAEVSLTALLASSHGLPKCAIVPYATLNWQEHVRRSGTRSYSLCKEFLGPCPAYAEWVSEVWGYRRELRPHDNNPLAPLLVACFYDLVDIVEWLLRTETNLNPANCGGLTPLHFSATNGNQDTARLLLEQAGVDVDGEDDDGRTPLSWAAERGHGKVVQMLFEKEGVDVDHKDNVGRTPLSWAAERGREKVVQMLLGKETDVDSMDNEGQTPLSWTARNGHAKVVQMLLEKDGVNVNSEDDYGRTPLSWAAESGHERVVQMLLEKDGVDVDSKDSDGRTPLSFAAVSGDEKVVQMLLEKETEVDSKDNKGRTVLFFAARNGNEKVVQMLLEKETDVDSKDIKGRTVLSSAARHGHEKVVQMLLEKETDVNSKDTGYGRTPLSWAAENGHEEVVQMLLMKDGVDVDSKDDEGQTPLSWAAECGHEKVVQLLLMKDGVNVDSKKPDGRTPLSFAAQHGHEKVVQLLLMTGGVDLNSKDTKYGQTPLSRAAENGCEKVVQLLLEKDGVDVDSEDTKFGRTPLSYAAEHGYEKVVQILLMKDGVDVDSKDNDGQTPLSFAAKYGRQKVVRVLLEKDGVDVDSKDSDGRTPLSYAAEHGCEKVVQLLLEKGGVDLNNKDTKYGQTPLSRAVENGYEEVVQMLLMKDGVDVNGKDTCGRSPLSIAVGKGYDRVVQMLLEKDGVDMNHKDSTGRRP